MPAHGHVLMFPAWTTAPYITQLIAHLSDGGWDVTAADRRGFVHGLRAKDTLVHIHWPEALTPDRSIFDGVFAWACLPLIALAARRGGVVWTVHNFEPHEGFPPLVGRRYYRALARCVSALIVHRESTREKVAQTFGRGRKIYLTPQASFGAVHGALPTRGDARVDLGIDPDALVFVQLGQLRGYKLPVETINAFRQASPKRALLLMSGRCPDAALRDEIDTAAEGASDVRVETEFLSDEDLVTRIAASDWMIAPYRAIENPTTLQLAIAYDRPVIAPRLAAVEEALGAHPSILYDSAVEAQPEIAAAFSLVADGLDLERATNQSPMVTWTDQARATAAVYEDVRAANNSRR
ncbi:MAG TPA: hypothetical protein VGO97_00955 [Solirubrobacterales bacterium]|nr:hypothetical protein [Solirubrobacterales bacterium]